jgi:DNA-directed RNA polymerase subunit RPC12/RpoP
VDGSFVSVKSENMPPKELSFVKTALLTLDRSRLETIDKEHPHPLLLQDVLTGSAIFHATVFPLKNIRTTLGSNYDAVRHVVRDSMKVDENGEFYETLKWIAYQKWSTRRSSSPSFECPHCNLKIEDGLPENADESKCPHCGHTVFLTDMIGFHLDMDEASAPDSVPSAYMLVMELLMLFTPIRLLWSHTDKQILRDTLFIKDGPLTLRSQYSKLVPRIRAFLQHAKDAGRPIQIVGQEKSGAFFDHLGSIERYAPPHSRGDKMTYAVLSHDYVRREVYRSPDLSNPYGSRTNWGEKLYLKLEPGTYMVLNVPTGEYNPSGEFPTPSDLVGLERILATLPSLVSYKFEGALFPVELANGIASMSSYPSARILERFVSRSSKD